MVFPSRAVFAFKRGQAAARLRKVLQCLVLALCTATLSACITHGRQAEVLPRAESSIPRQELTIALLGATGMVGSYILDEALAKGYDIRALARTPAKLEALKDHITIIKGDARDPAAINALLQGSDVVISALGPVKSDGKEAIMLSTTASGLILQSMAAQNIARYIVVSGAAVEAPGDSRNLTGWLVEQSANLTLAQTVKDKQKEYQLLSGSSVDWTLIRCPLIKPEPYLSQPKASLNSPSSFNLRAGELARFAVQQIASTEFSGKAPFLNSQ